MTAHRMRRGGPSPHARLPRELKAAEGAQVYALHIGRRLGFRDVGAQLGMSPTTAWRRFWYYQDAVAYPDLRQLPRDHVPPQRGTRSCPRGEPALLTRPAGKRIRHPLPAVRCGARRRAGGRCGRWAIRGAAVCPFHGGNAPQVRRAAARRVQAAVELDRALYERLAPRDPEVRRQDVRALLVERQGRGRR